jgi:hypothetical protein
MGVSNKFFVASCFWVIQHFDSFSGITPKLTGGNGAQRNCRPV